MPTRNTIFPALASSALVSFDTANPVDFNLFDDEGRQHIYILDDQSPGRTHHLVLANHSEADLKFQPAGGNHIPSRANHHFELRFRPGTLHPEYLTWLTIGTGGWRLGFEEHFESDDEVHDGTVSLYLLFVGKEELILPAGRTQMLILHHVKAGTPGGSRGSRMEMRYQTDGAELMTTPTTELLHKRQERLQIINQRGKKELPMLAAFEGSSTVLNDGRTANELTLQISNFLHNSTIALNARDSESPTKFILSFDTSEEQSAWALCDNDNAAAIDVEVHFEEKRGTNWHVRAELQGNNPQWIITLIDHLDFQVGEFFHLHLEGLKTGMPSGFTTLYILYENIPGFWDGRFEIPIEKSPLKFDDQKETEDHRGDGRFIQKTKVGIGNTEPVDTLDINGGLESESLVLRSGKKYTAAERQKVDGEKSAFPLQVEGRIRAEGINLTGEVVTGSSATDALHVSDDLTLGTVKMSEEGTSKNIKVEGRLKDQTGFVIPPGGIIMWSGTTVPEGWILCDGDNGTPDLRSRFVIGAGQGDGDDDRGERLVNYPLNSTGGRQKHGLSKSEMPSHSHTLTDPGHHHSYTDKMRNITSDGGGGGVAKRAHNGSDSSNRNTGSKKTGITVGNAGGSRAHENRPPYWALAFIMKL